MSSLVIFDRDGVVAEWNKGRAYTIRGPHAYVHTAPDHHTAMRIAETMVNALTVEQLTALPIGAAVRLPMGADAYPDFHILEPMNGVVSAIEPDCMWVRIDRHHAELDDWDNQVQVWFWTQDDGHEMPGHVVTLREPQK